MTVPDLPPVIGGSRDWGVKGLWAVTEVGGTEVSAAFMPWGPAGVFEEMGSSDIAAASIIFRLSPESRADVYYRRRNAEVFVNIVGDGDTLPANSTVKFYLGR